MIGVNTPAGTIYRGTTVPALVLDLDGTVRHKKGTTDPKGGFIEGPEDIELYPDVEFRIWEYRNQDYLIFGCSNQGGVAFGFKTWQQADAELDATLALFERNPFHSVQQCYHHEDGKVFPYNKRSLYRKPGTGMLAFMETEAFEKGFLVDWDHSLFVGDRAEDQQCAVNAGIPFQWAHDFFHRQPIKGKEQTP